MLLMHTGLLRQPSAHRVARVARIGQLILKGWSGPHGTAILPGELI